ncbi:MAG: glycosyltransferase, partial [Planctomycetota bacterium]|nr:glycosyltransferase [Planctomycetota bacterium]
REGRRWAYYLEVNRVAAEAIQRYLADGPASARDRFRTVIEAAAERLTRNSEIDGLALFLNAVLDRCELDAAAADDDAVQRFIQALNEHSEGVATQQQPAALQAPTADDTLGALAREELKIERVERISLERQVEDLEARIEESTRAREQLEEAKRTLYQDQRDRIARASEQEQRIAELYDDQQSRIEAAKLQEQRLRDAYGQAGDQRKQREQAEDQLRGAHEKVQEVRAKKEAAESQLGAARHELEAAKRQLAQAESRYQGLQRSKDDVQGRLDARKQELSRAIQALREAEQTLAHSEAALAQETAHVHALEEAKSLMSKQVRELQQEIARLLQTPEFRLGNFLWNKLPLGRISRMAKKWYQRLFNAKERAKIKHKSSKQREGAAVVAACWQWPIYSHTFVYQEMVSLRQTGLDVQLFHWDLGGTDQLHAAFQYLYDNRTQLQPEWETHKKDKEHFERTRPGRLRAFLERISPLCGKSVDELEKAPIVMQACTFARTAELANARYLHSYFFYDQSFMAMLAAWLLELPRGVSCYADHMMDDYEFKFVPLHIELADVIVATSARIKQELSELSGGKFDDKIVVKPNGVDGERFPPRARPLRRADEPFEVLSVSRIEPKKGLTHLVEAMAELKKRGHTVIAHIIGSKDPNSAGSVEYAEMFEGCIAEHGLQDQVILHGMMKQEEMPPIIEKCRAFVAPYVETESGDKDGIPTAMLEALASSLPIITTNSGSITEVVDDGAEGLVVAQRDSAAYADALAKVIEDPQLELQMAAAARARFDRDFDIKVTEKRLHERIHGFLDAQD